MAVKVESDFDLMHAPSGEAMGGCSAELRLLLAAAGAAVSSKLDEIQAGGVDWERLLKMAGWHGVKPLLRRHLEQLPAGIAPEHVLADLGQASRQAALRNLALASELLIISRELRAREIEHLSYKGPLLASDLYGNLALRVSGDVDIVVPKAKLAEACSVLGEIGYKDKSGFTAAQQAAAFRFGFEHTFRSPAGIDVDLHWRLVPTFVSPSLDEPGLWRRAVETEISGQRVPTFCPDDLFFVLCLHAGQHEWAQLSMFCDLAQTLNRYPEMNWDALRRHLNDSNTTRTVLVSLCLLHAHWEVNLPRELIARISADKQVQKIANRVQGEFWPSAEPPFPRDTSLRWIWQRTQREPYLDRLRYIAGIAFNPTTIDYETFRLPRHLMVLYPLFRGARLALKSARIRL